MPALQLDAGVSHMQPGLSCTVTALQLGTTTLQPHAGCPAADSVVSRFLLCLPCSPGIRTVCEVGFNAGYSAAVWLESNPTVKVIDFDMQDQPFKKNCVAELQRLHPGRLELHAGQCCCSNLCPVQ